MEPSAVIHFVRHGQVQNQSKVYYGRLLGFPLSEEGRLQAALTRECLSGERIAAIYSVNLPKLVPVESRKSQVFWDAYR